MQLSGLSWLELWKRFFDTSPLLVHQGAQQVSGIVIVLNLQLKYALKLKYTLDL